MGEEWEREHESSGLCEIGLCVETTLLWLASARAGATLRARSPPWRPVFEDPGCVTVLLRRFTGC